MPTSIEQVQEFLDEFDLRYRVDPDHDAVLIGFDIDPEASAFRDPDGDPCVRLVIRVLEHGEFLTVFCPWGWNVDDCPNRSVVFEALAAIQCQYKMLRFDYDPQDGEIRPNVELPVEDAEITSRQFHRLIHGMLHGVQRFDGVIRHAMKTGEVSFAAVTGDQEAGAPSATVARLQRLAEAAGGVEEFERIACGWCLEEPTTKGLHEAPAPVAARPGPEPTAPPPPRGSILGLLQWLFNRCAPCGP